MASLGRAWERVRGKQAPAIQAYVVRCICGVELQGRRAEHGLQLPCPACGELVFVLPRSPYPVPRGKALERPVAPPPPPLPSRRKQVAKGSSLTERLGQRMDQAEVASRDLIAWFTPTRLLTLLALVLIVATSWWSWSRWRRNEFVMQLDRELAAGIEALDRGEFVAARGALEKADRAARGLGQTASGADRASQYLRESCAWEQLSQRSLDDFFGALAGASPQELVERFQAEMVGRSAIFDATLTEVEMPDSDQVQPGFDWLLVGDGYQVELEVPKSFSRKETPQRWIFGAELQAVIPGKQPGHWRIRLRENSVALLTREPPLTHFGWPVDDATRQVIARQREAMGITE